MTKKKDIKPIPIATGIEKITKGNPFKVPENYFDNFPIRMSDKISETEEAKADKRIFIGLRPKVAAMLVFASIGLLIYIGIKFIGYKKDRPLSAQELLEVYEYSALQNIDDIQLMQLVATKTKEQQAIKDTSNKSDIQYNKEIIEYLSNENIDINTIIETL